VTRRAGLWLRLALSAAVLGALLAWVPLGELRRAVTGVGPWLWLGCLGLFAVGHACGAMKWRLLVGLAGASLRPATAVRLHFAGLFANLFLPSVAGGDLVRAGLAMRSAESRTAVALGSVIDRLFDTAALGVLVLIGGVSAGTALSRGDAIVLWSVLGTIGVAGAAGLLGLLLPAPGFLPERLSRLIRHVQEAGRRVLRRPLAAASALAASLAIQGTFVWLNSRLGQACGIDQPLGIWLFAWPLAKLTAMAPVSLAGIGVREAALAAVLGRFGVPPSLAVAQGLVWETILIATGGSGGLFYAGTRGREAGPA